MKKSALILVVLFLSMAFYLPTKSFNNKNSDHSELSEHITSKVISILQGEKYSDFKENISLESYVINQNSYENLNDVLSNPSKKAAFIEGADTKLGYMHMILSENEKEAYLVLETKSTSGTKINWHSIFLKIGENQKWQIISWHKS